MQPLPAVFNAATYFIDRHLTEGRAGKTAIEWGDEKITYQQLGERVNRAGSALKNLGMRREERVALLLLDTPDFGTCFFGAIKAGGIPVPMNTMLQPAEYEYMLNDCRARILIVNESVYPLIEAIPRERLQYLEDVLVAVNAASGETGARNTPGDGRTVTFLLEDVMVRSSPFLTAEPTSKDDAAFWLYSSGSTGFPKGCIHLHHDLVVTSECYAKAVLNVQESDRLFSVAKLFFAYGMGNGLYFSLAVGATTILWPGSPAPNTIFGIIEKSRPTLFFSVPSNFATLLSYRRESGQEFDLSSVRHAISAGEALPAAIFHRFKERFGVEILDAIGSTEALHMFIANRPGAVRPGSSGQLLPSYEARIVDEDDRPVPDNQVGNLLIKGDSICAGYWNQHEKTKDTIQGHWLRTGDKYYRDEDGYYWYIGRNDDMMKVKGLWVSPVEVENILIEHPAVQEAAVIGYSDLNQLVKPAAYVVLKDSVTENEKNKDVKHTTPAGGAHAQLAEELKQLVTSRLAAHKCPQTIEFVTDLPKTATGKIQRYKLRESRSGS
ncbi:MAG TPA: benzoate-CoA ligase family protein [Candidatus Saccharimonadales bacterium]|jgi:benzoate-CoA ligase family protein|nr:benzoate-CoA ligase family protein [Candidatus Saccharimonadales bacterium]